MSVEGVICVVRSAPDAEAAALLGLPSALCAYRAGRNGRLYAAFQTGVRCDIMGIDCGDMSSATDHIALTGRIMQEAAARHYAGILLFNCPTLCRRFYEALLFSARKENVDVFLPERLAAGYDTPFAVMDASVTCGDLRSSLISARARLGDRLALRIGAMSRDFIIPCPNGRGTKLSDEALKIAKSREISYFSPELQCNYFTCTEGAGTHFVLWDDASTLRQKLSLARSVGVSTVFMLPEDIRSALLSES